MNPFQTPGAFSWSGLMTPDPEAAARFCGSLFGWTVKAMDMGTGPYHVASVGDDQVAGLMKPPPEQATMPPMWGVYITVSDADETVARCEAHGGKVLVPAMDVPTVGRMAVLQDPQGAVFSVMADAMG
jgi:predicted enzyme related to lactoylglutathione lyase